MTRCIRLAQLFFTLSLATYQYNTNTLLAWYDPLTITSISINHKAVLTKPLEQTIVIALSSFRWSLFSSKHETQVLRRQYIWDWFQLTTMQVL